MILYELYVVKLCVLLLLELSFSDILIRCRNLFRGKGKWTGKWLNDDIDQCFIGKKPQRISRESTLKDSEIVLTKHISWNIGTMLLSILVCDRIKL